jgi:hypothetical protein
MPRLTPLAASVLLTAVSLAVVPAAAAAPQQSVPTPESPAPTSSGPDLSGLPGAIADAFKAAIQGASDQFWTTFNQTLPKLVVDSFFTFIDRIATWIYDGLTELLETVNIVTQTPPRLTLTSVGLPAVQGLFENLRGVALVGIGLVVLIAGFGIMSRTIMGGTYPEFLEMLPRLAVGVLWIMAFPFLLEQALIITNQLCVAIMGASGTSALPGAGEVQPPGGQPATGAGEQALALLVFAIAGVFLFVQSLIRVAVLNFAIVLAPFALLCWVLPQWYWLYSIWMRVLVATFLTQVLQTLAIALGSVLLSTMLGWVGSSGPAAPLLAAAMGVATVMAAWSLPKQVVGAWGPSLGLPKMMLAAAATGAAVARGASAVSGAGSAAGAAGVAGAAAAARGITSIVPLPPPPMGAPTSAIQGTAVPPFPGSIPSFPG